MNDKNINSRWKIFQYKNEPYRLNFTQKEISDFYLVICKKYMSFST